MSPWTDDAVAELKRLWADGFSSVQVAEQLQAAFGGHLTRSSIIGKVHRLGLPVPEHKKSPQARRGGPHKPRRIKSPVTEVGGAPRKTVKHLSQYGGRLGMVEMPAPEPVRELSADDIPLSQRRQLADLGPYGILCRWPYGDVGAADFFFCGAASAPGCRPYCAYHTRIASGGRPSRTVTTSWLQRRA